MRWLADGTCVRNASDPPPERTVWHADPKRMEAEARDSEAGQTTPMVQVTSADGPEPNLASSLTVGGWHSPVLDIDFPARLVPSSTPGHFHLYLDGIEMPWDRYKALLVALADAGVLGEGYVHHSLARQQTVVRAFGCVKPSPLAAAPGAALADEEPF